MASVNDALDIKVVGYVQGLDEARAALLELGVAVEKDKEAIDNVTVEMEVDR